MAVPIILLLLMASVLELVASSPHTVLERYEERLNSALQKRTGTPRTVKRYKCVEEYVTYDQHGHAVTSYQGTRFTTTMKPPVYRTSGEREVRRKPAKKVTISMSREETSTPMAMTSTPKTSPTTTAKPFDELNDEEADRIIEEMYLKKKESHTTESPTKVPQTTLEVAQKSADSPKPQRPYATDSMSSSSQNSGMKRQNRMKQNNIESEESEEDYSDMVYHRGSRKRPYENYEDYDDELPIYRPMRREFRMRRRRPILFSDDFSDDADFERRLSNTPRRQTTRDLTPLRTMKRLRHQVPFTAPYRPQLPSPMALPVSATTNMLGRPLPLSPVPHPAVAPPPALNPLPSIALQQPGMLPFSPPLQPIQQQSATNVRPTGDEVLKMKPILQADAQEMQVANEASCSKITTIAKNFGIKDVSKWARSNCSFLQMYAPTASCELIFHFIDSCKSKKFL